MRKIIFLWQKGLHTQDMFTDVSVKVFNRILEYIVPSPMDELPIEQSRSQPVNPSHVTINGLAHYCTHNASVNNSI